jgi:hypothetical protein
MRRVLAVLGIIFFLALNVFDPEQTLAQATQATEKSIATGDFSGELTNANGEPISNATITVKVNDPNREAVTDKEGHFNIKAVNLGKADIIFKAYGYDTIQEKGIQLRDRMDLSRTLREESAGPWLLLLFIPALFGMFVAALNINNRFNRFWVAFANGGIWVGILGGLSYKGITKYEFLYPSLTFEFYVPLLGFLGALLYVLELSRRGREDINREQEFQQRLILGPYVAIVMVVLFGKDLALSISPRLSEGEPSHFSADCWWWQCFSG